MPRRPFCNTTDRRRIAVKFTDAVTGKSVSLTVYGADLGDVALCTQARLVTQWRTTKLDDRRHKRR